ncbi:hypothetical protein FDUTEX481_09535 [Tolypothrix sp. PCC 7601]|nr:hypothetical protein FDUTEX481_09535 [Tolypothrix sp. PCC 7601]
MGHGKEHTNALCPMPQAAGQLSLSTHKGMEFPAAFNKKYKFTLCFTNEIGKIRYQLNISTYKKVK